MVQVPLGVLLLNENKIDHMCKILDELQKYVPVKTVREDITLPNGDVYTSEQESFFEIFLGGDQLTTTRARSAIAIRCTHDSNKEKLRGIIPVIEDWHARMTIENIILLVCIPYYNR